MKLTLVSDKRRAQLVDWLDTTDRIFSKERRESLQEWILDFAEHELFALVWTFLFTSVFGSMSYVLIAWLFGETYAAVGLLAMVSIILTMLVIFTLFPKSETEEKVSEILELFQYLENDLDEIKEDIATIKTNV